MSVEDAIRFFKNFDIDAAGEDFTVGSLLDRARAEGYQITEKDLGAAAQQIMSNLQATGELDDDQLDQVAGGLAGFQNADRMAARYTNRLASILKTVNEMQMGEMRNLR